MVTCRSCLSLVVCLSVLALPGRCCRDKEYLTRDGECCPMCHEGTVVRRDCTPLLGTGCSRCDNGTFMNQPNGLTKCFPCSTCVPGELINTNTEDRQTQAHGLFAQQNCTATTNTVCEVLSGYYCRSLANNTGCSMAEKHTPCAPGQRVKEPGTSRTDTVCEDCQPGYFSRDGVTCLAWTICSDTKVKVKEGSRSRDVVCSGASRNHSLLFTVLLLYMSKTLILLMRVC